MERYVARRSRIIRNNTDVDGGLIKCEAYDQNLAKNKNVKKLKQGFSYEFEKFKKEQKKRKNSAYD